jgi:hypothetical protein
MWLTKQMPSLCRPDGRQTRRQRAERQQLLTTQQEKALVDHLLRLHKNGYLCSRETPPVLCGDLTAPAGRRMVLFS